MAEEENMESRPADLSSSSRERSRPKALTPEQRRILGTPRSLHGRAEAEKKGRTQSAPGIERNPSESLRQQESRDPKPLSFKEESIETEPSNRERKRASRSKPILPEQKSSRALEMQNAFLITGAIFFLCLTFYVGKKFDYWRYLIASRHKPTLSEIGSANQFPNISSDELIEQALAAERSGEWKEAVEKLVAAKHKNLGYRGILFRVGKIAYDHGDTDNADKLFDRAIVFGENLDLANYFRGLIAVQRRDFPAAQRFFESAASAEPFSSQYYYYWAEAFRMDHHPREAISHYEQAERRAGSEQDATVCRFKVRLSRLEAGQNEELNTEIEKNRTQEPLSVDWLMTDAALKIHEGKIPEAVQLVSTARNANKRGLFISCTSDSLFHDASQKYPELAEACRIETAPQSTPP